MRSIILSLNRNRGNNSNVLLSPARMRYVRELVVAMRYQHNWSQLVRDLQSLETPLNLHDADETKRLSKQILDSMEGMLKFKYQPAIYVCAMFINRDDENVEEFNLEEVEAKIKDWGGFKITSFHR